MGYFVSAKYIPPIVKVWEATNFVCLRLFFLLLICLKQKSDRYKMEAPMQYRKFWSNVYIAYYCI